MSSLAVEFVSNPWIFLPGVVVALLLSSELGLRTGFKLYAKRDEARRSQIGGVQGAVLGLVGLLLGFTFAMGVGRHEAKRQLVLKEANAIGTAFLRAGLLPAEHQEPSRDLLRRYVDVRVEYRPHALDPVKFEEGLKLSSELQEALWSRAEAAAVQAPTPVVVSYITSLNEVIDTDAERVEAFRNKIPPTVWVLVLLVAAFGCFTSAYGSGAQGTRSNFTSFFLPILLSIVIWMIFDITHSLRGAIGVSQEPMLNLKESIAK